MLKKIFSSTLFLFLLFVSTAFVFAQSKVFTPAELAQFDGKDGRKAYYAYEGKVYDVSSSPLWKLGEHYGVHAGEDLTGKMEGAPHGMEVFTPFTVVGTYESIEVVQKEDEVKAMQSENPVEKKTSEVVEKTWYAGRLRFLGFSILGWTGIFLAISFLLTFSTCFALPWAKLPLPWAGSKPGPDALDSAPNHMGWSSVHKYFVWITVILGVIHGIIGFLQMVGVYL